MSDSRDRRRRCRLSFFLSLSLSVLSPFAVSPRNRTAQRPCNYHQPSGRRSSTPRMVKLNFSFPRHPETRDPPRPESLVCSVALKTPHSPPPLPLSLSHTFHLRHFPVTSPTPVIVIVKKNPSPGSDKRDVPSCLCLIIMTLLLVEEERRASEKVRR